MAHTLFKAFVICPIKVVLENGCVFWMRTIVNDHLGTLAWGETANISKTLGHDGVRLDTVALLTVD
jgi:hypothetical protein